MHLTISSILTEADVTVTIGSNPLSQVSHMLNRDFSEQYLGAASNQFFAIEIDVANLGYFAISGANLYDNSTQYALQYWDGAQWLEEATYIPDWNATTLWIIQNQASKYRLYITKDLSNVAMVIPYIAAGEAWEVPNNGEEAGYARIWSVPQLKQRTQDNQGMPTSHVIQSDGIKGGLKISNLLTTDVDDVWMDFQAYALHQGFFIVEDDFNGDRAYYCYNVKPEPVKAHPTTRKLQVASIKFDCWTGRTS